MDKDDKPVVSPHSVSTIWCRCGIPFCCRCRSPTYVTREKAKEKEKIKEKKIF